MKRRTTIGIAAGITLGLAAVALTIIVNLGIMSDATSSGPGNFVPTAALSASQPSGTALVDDLNNTTNPVVDDASVTTTTSQATDPDHEADSAHHADDSHHEGRADDD